MPLFWIFVSYVEVGTLCIREQKLYSTIKLYHQELGYMLYFTQTSSPCMKDAFEQSWATNSLCEPDMIVQKIGPWSNRVAW